MNQIIQKIGHYVQRNAGYIMLASAVVFELAKKSYLFQQIRETVLSPDAIFHLRLVHELSNGDTSALVASSYPPLFHYFLTPLYTVMDVPIFVLANIAIILISVCLLLGIYILVRTRFSPTIAGIVTLLFSFLYPFSYRGASLLPENLAVFFFIIWLYVAIKNIPLQYKFVLLTLFSTAVLYTNTLTSTQLLTLGFFLITYFVWRAQWRIVLLYGSSMGISVLFALSFIRADPFWVRYVLMGGIGVLCGYSLLHGLYLIYSSQKVKSSVKWIISVGAPVTIGIVYFIGVFDRIENWLSLNSYWPLTNFSKIVEGIYTRRFILNTASVFSIHPIIWVLGVIGLLWWLIREKRVKWIPFTLAVLLIMLFSVAVFGGFIGIDPYVNTDRSIFLLMVPLVVGYGAWLLFTKRFIYVNIVVIILISITSFPYTITAQLHDPPVTYDDIDLILTKLESLPSGSRYFTDSTLKNYLLIHDELTVEYTGVSAAQLNSDDHDTTLRLLLEVSLDYIIESPRLKLHDTLTQKFETLVHTEHYTLWKIQYEDISD